MEPGQVLVALLYLWLAFSLGVYAWRAYRRLVHGETRQDRAARRAEEAPSGTDRGDRAVSASGSGEDAAPGRRGVFAPRGATDGGAGRRTGPTVAELVEGISLPCGLVPIVAGAELDPYRAVFATDGHDAGEVGAALADELERLGFELRSETETEAVARRGDDELRVRVEPDPAAPAAPLSPAPPRVIAELSS